MVSIVGTTEVVSTSTAVSVGNYNVCYIRVNLKSNITDLKTDFGIAVGSFIVQKWLVTLIVVWVSLMMVALMLLRDGPWC